MSNKWCCYCNDLIYGEYYYRNDVNICSFCYNRFVSGKLDELKKLTVNQWARPTIYHTIISVLLVALGLYLLVISPTGTSMVFGLAFIAGVLWYWVMLRKQTKQRIAEVRELKRKEVIEDKERKLKE